MKAMKTCAVCGRDFALIFEDHYIARDDGKRGVINAIAAEEETLYDAIDCPHCGCQNILQERKRTVEDEELDYCDGCEFENKAPEEEPCNECSRAYYDEYEPKE